jgi:hypothetical protein
MGGEHGPSRIFLIETEFLLTVTRAELEWAKGVVKDLRADRLKMDWTREEMAELAQTFTPPE